MKKIYLSGHKYFTNVTCHKIQRFNHHSLSTGTRLSERGKWKQEFTASSLLHWHVSMSPEGQPPVSSAVQPIGTNIWPIGFSFTCPLNISSTGS